MIEIVEIAEMLNLVEMAKTEDIVKIVVIVKLVYMVKEVEILGPMKMLDGVETEEMVANRYAIDRRLGWETRGRFTVEKFREDREDINSIHHRDSRCNRDSRDGIESRDGRNRSHSSSLVRELTQ